MAEKILHLTLMKKWFDEILSGEKKIEYREIKPYWTKRLFDEEGEPIKYDFVFFRNGYAKDCRKMKVEFKGLKVGKEYEIVLGKVVFVNKELVQRGYAKIYRYGNDTQRCDEIEGLI